MFNAIPSFLEGWSGVEAGLEVLLYHRNACFKGPALHDTCSALKHLATTQSRPSGDSSVMDVLGCFVTATKLLARLLAARKRPRDWKQQDYSSRVCSMLAAAPAVLNHPSLHSNPVVAGKMATKLLAETHLLMHVAAAQQEVAELLAAQAAQPQQQRLQPGNQHGQVLLLQAAQQLLQWWVEAHKLWLQDPYCQDRWPGSMSPAHLDSAHFAFHVHAVKLAGAVATAAGPNSTTEQFLVLAQVVSRVAWHQKWAASGKLSQSLKETGASHYGRAAYLRLSLTMLLVLSHLTTRAAPPAEQPAAPSAGSGGPAPCSSTSGSTAASSSGTAGSSSTAAAGVPLGKGSDSSSNSNNSLGSDCSNLPPAEQQEQQEQQRQKLDARLLELWQQLGWRPDALPVFADAVQADPAVLSNMAAAVASTHSAASASGSSGGGSSSVSSGSGGHASPGQWLLPGSPLLLQALDLILQELSMALYFTIRPPSMPPAQWRQRGSPVSLDALSRQQQQLLQAVCWLLPGAVLRTVLLVEARQPLTVMRAAQTSHWALLCQHAPGMHEAAGRDPLVLVLESGSVLDCWCLMMQQLLLQLPRFNAVEPTGSPPAAAAAVSAGGLLQSGGTSEQQQQQQQPAAALGLLLQAAASARVLPRDSSAAQELLGAGSCGCTPEGGGDSAAAVSPDIGTAEDRTSGSGSSAGSASNSATGSTSSSTAGSNSSLTCVTLSCDSLFAVRSMLLCLLTQKVSSGLLGNRAGRVLQLLEVLARRVLSQHVTCSCSSGNKRSSAADSLRRTLIESLSRIEGPVAQALLTGPLYMPHLQPSVLALLTSLHKLSRQELWDCHSTPPAVAATARFARDAILTLHDWGTLDATAYAGVTVLTVRHMLAPWVLLIGRCCCALGCWLQQWQQEVLQELQHQPSDGGTSSSSSSSSSSTSSSAPATLKAALSQASAVRQALNVARFVIGSPDGVSVGSLWETAARGSGPTQALSAAGSSTGSNSTQAADDVPHPGDRVASALLWQQWRAAVGEAQQQQAPAYSSIAAEFGQLSGSVSVCVEQCLSLVLQTGNRIAGLGASQFSREVLGSQDAASTRGGTTTGSSSGGSSSGKADDEHDADVALQADQDQDQGWLAAQQAVSRAGSGMAAMQACVGYEGFARLSSKLQQVGAALCAKLPLPWLCNNPGCTSMAGASELQLVGGKACICGGCRVARYCGRGCQEAHWALHKPVCRHLAAQQAAAAAAADS